MKLPIYQVDAFADVPFRGNPAAVCPLENWLDERLLQSLAAENNLSETAYFVRREDGDFDLRWFTPAVEVDLCGHATLASAFVVLSVLEPSRIRVAFHTRSGRLEVARAGEGLEMDFPSQPPSAAEASRALSAVLGAEPVEVLEASAQIAVFETAEQIRDLDPDFRAMTRLPLPYVSVTAPGTGQDADVDFVSRFFAPSAGIDEDPVTGSAHCYLTPYWSARTGRQTLRARQVSARGGELTCTLSGDRVRIAGQAVLVLEGHVLLP